MAVRDALYVGTDDAHMLRLSQTEDKGIQYPDAKLHASLIRSSLEEFASVAVSLRERVDLGPAQLYRLVGLSSFQAGGESE
jgi:hypothetical protein